MDQLSAHLDRGWDLVQRGDALGAEACARRALEIDPESPEVHNLLGYSAAMNGELEDAIEHYKHAIALDESYFEAMLNAAEILVAPLGDFQEALTLVDDALDYAETDEETTDCLLLQIDALMGLGKKDEAKKVLGRLPKGPFNSPNYSFLIGRSHYELGEAESAWTYIEEALKSAPDSADALYYRGLLLDDKGDKRGATEAFLRSRMYDALRAPPPWSPKPEDFGVIVKNVLAKLEPALASFVREAEVYVVDLPGAELVVDGVDPRSIVLLDRPNGLDGEPSDRVRIFVYQRSVELAAGSVDRMENELQQAFDREIAAVFAETAPAAKPIEKDHLLN